ncbi:MAG: nuclear transport factor 2 family protein [Alphaproteobacteria bacterium]|nr:nuclear transport factor 2 family protein [Alphaproteobacteria bacterium]
MTRSKTVRRLLGAAAILGGLLAATAYALGPGQESELIALSNAWIDAEVHHDKAALERLLDERFLVTLASGKTIDRTAFVDRIMKTEIKPFEVLNEVVNVHGDAALVISTTKDHTTKFTWIAVKKEGQWRVISETFSKITEPN